MQRGRARPPCSDNKELIIHILEHGNLVINDFGKHVLCFQKHWKLETRKLFLEIFSEVWKLFKQFKRTPNLVRTIRDLICVGKLRVCSPPIHILKLFGDSASDGTNFADYLCVKLCIGVEQGSVVLLHIGFVAESGMRMWMLTGCGLRWQK